MKQSRNYIIVVGLFLGFIGLTGCQTGSQPAATTAPTFTVEPSPTVDLFPPTFTPTIPPEPSPTNTLVVQATFTPKPATDTPTPLPTDTPAPEAPATAAPTPTPIINPGPIDWEEDAEGEPTLIRGQDEGYFIWTDEDQLYVRGMSRGDALIFRGQITGNRPIVNINEVARDGVDLTIDDEVNQVDFAWATQGGPEGIDFTFTGTTLAFNLQIESVFELEPHLVFVGEEKLRVTSVFQLVRE